MPELDDLRQRAFDLFRTVTPARSAVFRAEAAGLEAAPERAPIPHFSEFVPEHMDRAQRVWNELFQTAEGRLQEGAGPEDALEAVLGVYEEKLASGEENPDLLEHALLVFISHHREGRKLSGAIPPLAMRKPALVAPSAALTAEAGAAAPVFRGTSSVPEDLLDWYREDPLLNEHHVHWHVVYPFVGIAPKPGEAPRIKDRQGELFIYMHEQMIARYDAERIAAGVGRIRPHGDFNVPIPPGYDAGSFINSFGFTARAANTVPRDVVLGTAPNQRRVTGLSMQLAYERLAAAIDAGFLEANGKRWRITPELLGSTVESNIGGADGTGFRNGFYGNFHNNGHILIALINGMDQKPGAMFGTSTANRDPIFLRWHKAIDDLSFRWQERQAPHELSDAPAVVVRQGLDAEGRPWTPDIIVVRTEDLPPSAAQDPQAFGRRAFGGARWHQDFSSGEITQDGETFRTADRLQTHMHKGTIEVETGGQKQEIEYDFLNHDPFCYFFRIQNELPVAKTVSVRVWIVPEGQEEDRRMWIEMDKFLAELGPEERAVVYRSDLESSVIRKPAVVDPAEYNRNYRPVGVSLPSIAQFAGFVDELRKGPTTERRLQIHDALNKGLEDAGAVLDEYRRKGLHPEDLIRLREEARQRKALADVLRTQPESPEYRTAVLEYAVALSAFLVALADFVYRRVYCECGWPYSLLLPRGTRAGMRFKLMVMVTDWDKDRVGRDTCCGSLSYCGALDRYPDARPMGYPFDRPFSGGILETVAAQANMACRTLTIQWVDPKEKGA